MGEAMAWKIYPESPCPTHPLVREALLVLEKEPLMAEQILHGYMRIADAQLLIMKREHARLKVISDLEELRVKDPALHAAELEPMTLDDIIGALQKVKSERQQMEIAEQKAQQQKPRRRRGLHKWPR